MVAENRFAAKKIDILITNDPDLHGKKDPQAARAHNRICISNMSYAYHGFGFDKLQGDHDRKLVI